MFAEKVDHGEMSLLCMITFLLNDNQLKKSIETSDDFCQSRQRFLLCMN